MEEEEHKNEAGGNVLVLCRFRPLNQEELKSGDLINFTISENNKNLTLASSCETGEPLKFNFDYIFPSNSAQHLVYSIAAKPIVEAVMQGFNGTVFAYGQTSSGKTFTMSGPDLEDPQLMGVIPRMVRTVFDMITNSELYIEYAVKVSYCEIYLEKIKDLLDCTKVNLQIHEDKTRGVYISELSEKYVASENDVYEIMKFGLSNRNTGSTNMNAVSSRSHSLFLITISQTNHKDYISKTGKLYLVDLAGSEKVGKTGATGKRLDEAKNINKSLTMLGMVIYSLTDGKSTHIPYRDSKLTRVLQDSLGGNSKTSLIITCSPSLYNEPETISTLRFGMRAKSIKNTPKINREYTVAELKLIYAKCKEEMLKKDKRIKHLEDFLSKSGVKIEHNDKKDSDDESEHQDYEKTEATDAIIDELEAIRTLLEEKTSKSIQLKMVLVELSEKLNDDRYRFETLNREKRLYQDKIQSFEPNLERKENLIRGLEKTEDQLKSDLQDLNQKIIDLEKKNREIETDLQEFKQNDRGKSSMASFKDLLRVERDTNEAYQKEIQSLRQNLTEILNKKCPGLVVSELIKKDIIKKEREEWIEERKKIILELQKGIDRLAELEMLLENAKASCKNIEGYMNDGERTLKKKTDTLERNLQQLTVMYHQLTGQKSQLGVDKKLSEKKLVKLNERNKFLEEENKRLAMNLEQIEMRISQVTDDLNSSLKNSRVSMNNANIKKTIMGGFTAAKRMSVKNPFLSDE